MSIKQYLEEFKDKLIKCNPESLKMSLNNVHAKEMFSLVVDGTEAGKLTRVFIAGKKLKPYKAQLHTHRYPITLTVLKGTVTQHTADIFKTGFNTSMYKYKSPLNGGQGLTYRQEVSVCTKDFVVPVGCQIHMDCNSFHTISCSKGAMWIVEELGFENDYSLVLGVPFITENLYTKPEMFQINDKHQLVLKTINKLVSALSCV